jgi:hypothetical protein
MRLYIFLDFMDASQTAGGRDQKLKSERDKSSCHTDAHA